MLTALERSDGDTTATLTTQAPLGTLYMYLYAGWGFDIARKFVHELFKSATKVAALVERCFIEALALWFKGG